jgi:probable phosphoglycerate mutase
VTHPQATHHVDGLVGGWYNSELTELGRLQAERIAARLRENIPEEAPVAIHSSDLRRCAETAEGVSRCLGASVQTSADWREISYGEAEGRPQAWLDARFIYPPRRGNRLDHQYGIPGAETRREFALRIYRAMERVEAAPTEHQVIVTHGFALTFVVVAWIGMPLGAAGTIAVRATSGGITYLQEDDLFANRAIVRLNDTAHLA